MSSAAGTKVDDECIAAYNDLKSGRKYKYVIFKLTDKKDRVIVDKKNDCKGKTTEEAHEELVADLPENDCRFVVYDLEYELSADEGKRNKIFFLYWASDNAGVRSKMTYSSSKDSLRKSLSGIGSEIQGTDYSEVSLQAFLEKAGVKKSQG